MRASSSLPRALSVALGCLALASSACSPDDGVVATPDERPDAGASDVHAPDDTLANDGGPDAPFDDVGGEDVPADHTASDVAADRPAADARTRA